MRRSRKPKPIRDSYEMSEEDKEDRHMGESHWFHQDPANRLVYDPGEKQRIPKTGAWAMITRQLPPIEGHLDEHIRVGRVFFIEHDASADEKGFIPTGDYKVVLHSQWGDVWLWPYEYSTIAVEDVLLCWQEGDLIFHPTNIDAARFNDIAFYARSRGVALAPAMVMALGTLMGSVGWFELHPDLVEAAEAMEERVHRWNPSKHSRRGKNQEVS